MDKIVQHKKRVAIILILIAVVAFVGWKVITSRQQQPQYQTARVEKGTIVTTVSGSGQILITNQLEVKTQATGRVSKVYVSDGEQVTAGQKILDITLDQEGQKNNTAAWSSYLSAKNSLDSAQAKLNSLQSALFKTNQKFINDAVARELKTDDPTYIQENADWLQAEADYKNQTSVITQAQASLNSAWLPYSLSSPAITAPISGTIGDLTAVEGMIISAQKITVIRSLGNPVASFNISEVDVSKIQKNQKATITLDSLPGKTFTGRVIGIDRTGLVTSGVTNYPATVQFDTSPTQILPNMAANVSIVTETKNDVLLVPSSGLQTQAGQTIAKVLRDGREVNIPVEVGIASDSQTEVISGLQESDEVIVGTISGGGTSTGGFSPFGATPFGGGGLRPGGFGGGGRSR